jgi:hypothetical protein
MSTIKQLTVWLDSAPGQIGAVARALSDAKINIAAFTCYSQTGASPLRLHVSEHAAAVKILRGLGLRVTEEEVLRLTVADRPGRLAEIGGLLGEAGINVDYAYGTAADKTRKADLVFAVSDPAGAERALKTLK